MDHKDHIMSTATGMMGQPTPTSTAGNGHSEGHVQMMNMYFATSYKTYVLFEKLRPRTVGEAVGVWIGIFVAAVIFRLLPVGRAILEDLYWKPKKASIENRRVGESYSEKYCLGRDLPPFFCGFTKFDIMRDAGRFMYRAIESMIGYGLMLVAMTLVVPWFFAVVAGLAFGEVLYGRCPENYKHF